MIKDLIIVTDIITIVTTIIIYTIITVTIIITTIISITAKTIRPFPVDHVLGSAYLLKVLVRPPPLAAELHRLAAHHSSFGTG